MKNLKKLDLTKEQKKFIDNLVKNAYSQGFLDGFKISGKSFNAISGMLKSKDFEDISKLEAERFMKDNEELFSKHYKLI